MGSHLFLATQFIAYKGYDSEVLRDFIRNLGANPVIPMRENSKADNEGMDWCLYYYRNLVENAFLKVKEYNTISTRYDKLAKNYHSMTALAFSMMWLPMWIG